MDYKAILKRIILLISSPAKAWEEIRIGGGKQKVMVDFVYPMIGLSTLAVFLGVMFSKGWSGPESFQLAMQQCCAMAISLFGGFFLAAYVINEICVKYYKMQSDIMLARQFVGYAMALLFIVQIITGLLPDFVVMGLFVQFYSVYIIWEGVPVLLEIKDAKRFQFTIIAYLLLVLCPFIIRLIFTELITILN